MAFAANEITHMGQPALLYIVPCTLGTLLATGAYRGELSSLWSFADASPSAEGGQKGEDQK